MPEPVKDKALEAKSATENDALWLSLIGIFESGDPQFAEDHDDP